jgi:hypothetical protein
LPGTARYALERDSCGSQEGVDMAKKGKKDKDKKGKKGKKK